MCGYPPFNGENDAAIIECVKYGDFSFASDEWREISDSAKDLIKNMLVKNTAKRFSADEVMNHKWLKSKNENKKDVK